METITKNNELQALQNAADTCNLKLTVCENVSYDDKRKTVKRYFLRHSNGPSISPSGLTYDQMNHYLLGILQFKRLLQKEGFISEWL